MVRGAAAARGTSDDGGPSILGRGARVRGRIGGEGDLRVEGPVEGNVAIRGDSHDRRGRERHERGRRRP